MIYKYHYYAQELIQDVIIKSGKHIIQTEDTTPGAERTIKTSAVSPGRNEPFSSMRSEREGCSCGTPGGSCVCNEPHSTQRSVRSMYIYALGRIEPRFPRLSMEKELAQATGRVDVVGLVMVHVVNVVETLTVQMRICVVIIIVVHQVSFVALMVRAAIIVLMVHVVNVV